MPNRMIRESCRTSRTLDRLSDGAERMFWRLTTAADDFGRFEAEPVILKASCFPLRVDSLSTKQVAEWFAEIVDAGLVCAYSASKKPYGVFVTWETHQRKRAQRSKFPAPPESFSQVPENTEETPTRGHPLSSADIRGHMLANVPEKREARSESREARDEKRDARARLTSASNDEPKAVTMDCDNAFSRFWTLYPRKVGKLTAEKAWRKLAADPLLVDRILKAVAEHARSPGWMRDGGQFVPHPATWLNGRRWEDELPLAGVSRNGSKPSVRDMAREIAAEWAAEGGKTG